jgi:predicted secreted protein
MSALAAVMTAAAVMMTVFRSVAEETLEAVFARPVDAAFRQFRARARGLTNGGAEQAAHPPPYTLRVICSGLS